MLFSIDFIERRIQQGWDKFPEPRPYISIKKGTYTKVCDPAIFIDSELGEWEATPDGVMRGGKHPKRRQRDYNPLIISKEELYNLYIIQNLSVKDVAKTLKCKSFKILSKIIEYGIQKPMDLKLQLMQQTNRERYGCDFGMQNVEISQRNAKSKDIEKFKRNYKKTMLERHGVENGFQKEEFIKKAQETRIERYGKPHALQVESIRERYLETIREQYNDNELVWGGTNVKEIREKVIAKNISNLGCEFPFQSKDIQEKVKKTFLKNYGVENIGDSSIIQEKIRKTVLARYGVHFLSLPEIREKIKHTSLEKYGYVCSLLHPDIQEQSYQTRLKNNSFKTSIPEQEVFGLVKTLLPLSEVQHNRRDIIPPYELDIVIPEKKIAIEYHGLFYHSEACVDTNYNFSKYKSCKKMGYRLISIFDHEWQSRKIAVISRLKAILGCNQYKIGARETQFEKAEKDEVGIFLNEFHLQGNARHIMAFKLVYNGMIVAIMTFARHHRQNNKEIVLNRFCVRGDYTVVGGAGKLLKNSNIKEPIISYSDNRWSDGDLYQHLNFKLKCSIRPDYFYISNKEIFSKQSLKKTKEERTLGKTEHELRLGQGYLRVYDCGKQKWILEREHFENTTF